MRVSHSVSLNSRSSSSLMILWVTGSQIPLRLIGSGFRRVSSIVLRASSSRHFFQRGPRTSCNANLRKGPLDIIDWRAIRPVPAIEGSPNRSVIDGRWVGDGLPIYTEHHRLVNCKVEQVAARDDVGPFDLGVLHRIRLDTGADLR